MDSLDFPELARTGLHSEEELARTRTITGRPVDAITALGRPGALSGAGFLHPEEDVISVLSADNALMARMGLTHAELAKPLFHLWNFLLAEYERGFVTRFYDRTDYLLYNGAEVRLGVIHPTKGFQESIFDDGIQGSFEINFYRELSQGERAFLRRCYAHLKEAEFDELIEKLTHVHSGEIEPYYVMRYGFYEGHTSYRADPIALAYIFGLKSLEQLEQCFPGRLHSILRTPFYSRPRGS